NQLRDSLATITAQFPSASRFQRFSSYVNGVSYEPPCDANVSTEEEDRILYGALIVKNTADAAAAAAEYFCLQSAPVPLVGGCINFAAACDFLAVVRTVAGALYEAGKFCTDDKRDPPISDGQDKLGIVHDDLQDHQSNPTTGQTARLTLLKTTLETRAATINSAVQSVDTDLTARANMIHAELVDHQTNLTTRANNIDAGLAAHQ